MAQRVGSLLISLGLESGAFKSGLNAAEKEMKASVRRIESFGKSMKGLGQNLSLAVTLPLLALGKSAVTAAIESQDAIGQVDAALKSMGAQAGRTSGQLEGLASGLMRKSLYDDDDILRSVTANLLTFGKVSGAQFDRAQQAAIDLATRLKMDLQPATLLVGKALNDPVKGLGALRKAGIQFTAQQKEQITAMVAAGNAAGAQSLMLAELERQFGGSAAAARKANPFAALQLSWNEFQEKVGRQLLKVLPNITGAIERVLDAFSNLSPGMQQAVVIGGVLAAALGPVLIGFGALVTAAAPFIAAIGAIGAAGGVMAAAGAATTAFATVLGPVLIPLAAIAAAGYLIYQNWDKIAPVLERVGAAVMQAIGPAVTNLVDAFRDAFDELMSGPLGPALRQLGPVLVQVGEVIARVFGSFLVTSIVSTAKVIGWAIDAIAFSVRALGTVFRLVFDEIPRFVGQMVRAVTDWLGPKLRVAFAPALAVIDLTKRAFHGLYDAVVGNSYIPDLVDGIAAQMARLDAVMVKPVADATAKAKNSFQRLAEEVRPLLDRLFPEVAALNAFRADLRTIDKGARGKAITTGQAGEARRRLELEGRGEDTRLSDLFELEPQTFLNMEKVQIELAKIGRAANDNGRSIEAANVRIVKSFKEMADDTLSALQGLVGAIKGGGVLDILSAVIGLATQLGSIGAFGKGVQKSINRPIPGYASGTGFHPGGLAMVGERGPELVNLPRGSSVFPNGTGPGGGGGNTYHISGNLLTPEFWQRIQSGDVAAARAGAEGGVRKIAYRGSRRLR